MLLDVTTTPGGAGFDPALPGSVFGGSVPAETPDAALFGLAFDTQLASSDPSRALTGEGGTPEPGGTSQDGAAAIAAGWLPVDPALLVEPAGAQPAPAVARRSPAERPLPAAPPINPATDAEIFADPHVEDVFRRLAEKWRARQFQDESLDEATRLQRSGRSNRGHVPSDIQLDLQARLAARADAKQQDVEPAADPIAQFLNAWPLNAPADSNATPAKGNDTDAAVTARPENIRNEARVTPDTLPLVAAAPAPAEPADMSTDAANLSPTAAAPVADSLVAPVAAPPVAEPPVAIDAASIEPLPQNGTEPVPVDVEPSASVPPATVEPAVESATVIASVATPIASASPNDLAPAHVAAVAPKPAASDASPDRAPHVETAPASTIAPLSTEPRADHERSTLSEARAHILAAARQHLHHAAPPAALNQDSGLHNGASVAGAATLRAGMPDDVPASFAAERSVASFAPAVVAEAQDADAWAEPVEPPAPVIAAATARSADAGSPNGSHDRRDADRNAEPIAAVSKRLAQTVQTVTSFEALLGPQATTLISTPAAIATPHIPNEKAVMASLVQSMRMQYRDGVGTAVLKLDPEFLGGVSISLHVSHGNVTATLQADSPEVRAWLEANEPALRQGLADHGLSLDQLIVEEIGVDDERQAPDDQQQSRKQEQERKLRARRNETATFEVVV